MLRHSCGPPGIWPSWYDRGASGSRRFRESSSCAAVHMKWQKRPRRKGVLDGSFRSDLFVPHSPIYHLQHGPHMRVFAATVLSVATAGSTV
eukprot:1536920-Alexandrium_andersonii.AAC.1